MTHRKSARRSRTRSYRRSSPHQRSIRRSLNNDFKTDDLTIGRLKSSSIPASLKISKHTITLYWNSKSTKWNLSRDIPNFYCVDKRRKIKLGYYDLHFDRVGDYRKVKKFLNSF